MTTREEIYRWLTREMDMNLKYSHMIVKTDTFDYSDYPVYVKRTENVYDHLILHNDMTKIMEVYNFDIDLNYQLNETTGAFNIEPTIHKGPTPTQPEPQPKPSEKPPTPTHSHNLRPRPLPKK